MKILRKNKRRNGGRGRKRLALPAKTTLLWNYNNHKEKKQFGVEEKSEQVNETTTSSEVNLNNCYHKLTFQIGVKELSPPNKWCWYYWLTGGEKTVNYHLSTCTKIQIKCK